MLRKLFLFLIGILLFTLAPQVKAAGDFATSYDVTYDVAESGLTTVTEKITLKNLTSQYYATQFKLIIGATEIKDVSASDPSGPINTTVEKQGTSTVITAKFNEQIAGLNKELPWTLKFTSNDFARKEGKIWEVSVPKVASGENVESYNVTLSVPVSFGEPSLITPEPTKQTVSFNKLFLNYDKDKILNSGISVSFGTNQLFNFDLTYHLQNSQLTPVITDIALPPDTNYQDVIFQRIDPKPMNVTVDADGNYLAWYRLSRGQKLDVRVIGSSKLYGVSKVKNPYLSDVDKSLYTKSQKYWEKDNPEIKKQLETILGKNPPPSNYEKAKLIERFVASNLKYDPSRLSSGSINRLGAVTALNNPDQAVCMEFTDLFIALARAADIPARELDGYAYTNNTSLRPLSLTKDILHAWPQYWDDRKGWVMVDPTWENTTGGVDYFDKLDLNHFVFAIKGTSSETPLPAGSYKYSGQNSNDVKVDLSESDFLGKPQLEVTTQPLGLLFAGFPGKIRIRVANQGNAVQSPSKVSVTQDGLISIGQLSRQSNSIPAYGYEDFEFEVRTPSLTKAFDEDIEIIVDGQKYPVHLYIAPFFLFSYFPYAALVIGAVFGLLYLLLLGLFIYRKRYLKRASKKKS